MDEEKIKRLADHLAEAERSGLAVEPITKIEPEISVEDAYRVQLLTVGRKVNAGAVILIPIYVLWRRAQTKLVVQGG